MMAAIISWEQFLTCNIDTRGIQFKFEDLCRQLFVNEFLAENKKQRHLHCNPNNPGLESEPVYDEKNERWIGYQAKFFEKNTDYSQIMDSVENIVKYYKGKVEHVYLFCNKALTTSCESYINIVKKLEEAGITLEPITDVTILDMVRKYSYLGLYYFDQNFLNMKWLENHTQEVLSKLGERYNDEFNIDTRASLYLSLFVHDDRALQYFNEKKSTLLKKVDELGWRYDSYAEYQDKIREAINQLEVIGTDTILNVLQWDNRIKEAVKEDIDDFEKQMSECKEQRARLLTKLREKNSHDSSEELNRIEDKIDKLYTLIELASGLQIQEIEKAVLQGKFLFVEGKAGVGKSHTFANEVLELLTKKQYALLMLGGDYLDDCPIQEQIASNLRINYSFEELIDILEVWGSVNNCIVPVFVDALNETWNLTLWKNGIPSIFNKIQEMEHVRLAVSFREEYKKQLFADLKMDKYEVCHIRHRGFDENSIEAAQKFMDHYGIPFTPLHLFTTGITNPLFLTLYCKTYQGDEVNLPTLYDRILQYANRNIHRVLLTNIRAAGYDSAEDLVTPVVSGIAEYILTTGKRVFTKQELIQLSVWNDLGLNARPFITQMIRENVLHSYVYSEEERIYFSYDQMNDYFCSKEIMSICKTKDAVIEYLINDVLSIKDGKIGKYGNRDLFINTCALYAEKYQEECIGIIDAIENKHDRNDLFDSFVDSLQWRKNISITVEDLLVMFSKYSAGIENVWEMFISNSVKITNSLNAEALHEVLLNYPLNKRDYLWTRYINGLEQDSENRIVQLINMYDKGEQLEFSDIKQKKLLLILFGWCLSSSNRWFRDVTSKAMIEILKEDFPLCEYLLTRFQGVNDPYIIQRLYGIVLGACLKRKQVNKEIFQSLVAYVYGKVFDCEKVYPDILLRDYARLIIERFVYEFPSESVKFDSDKITPPYHSADIPEIEEQGYLNGNFEGGTYSIISSMKFEGMGMYGDFGRYVFQSALSSFEIERKKIFNYAVYFVLHECGYEEKLFGEYDRHLGRYNYNLHNMAKLERIGKKYQWIAMYNILARVSDNCAKVDRFEKKEEVFEGAWDPYVRDFDPTLNKHFMLCQDVPIFQCVEEHFKASREENVRTFPHGKVEENEWIDSMSIFFELQKEDLILTDTNEVQWVVLTKYADTDRDNLASDKLLNWNWLYGYFVTDEQLALLDKYAKKKVNMLDSNITWIPEIYTLYSREFPWSPGSKNFRELFWKNIEIRTGEKEIVTEKCEVPDFSQFENLLKKYTSDSCENSNEKQDGDKGIVIPMREETYTKKIDKVENVGEILSATGSLLWEEEYDASKEEAISYGVPCAEIVEKMKLCQLEYDGYYYDQEGQLAFFDTALTKQKAGIIIRKDILDKFLVQMKMQLVWFVNGSKEIHLNDLSIGKYSDWTGVLKYDGVQVVGEIYRTEQMYE